MKLTPDILFNLRRKQSAQAMVEFALVLPILLLVIFMLIGFGHLLFSYSMVVAASREAARYGVATGLSDKNLPRFRDCDEIRAQAYKVGAVAGVRMEDIAITYDRGPKSDGSTPVAAGDCPQGGIGPGDIDIGNRIVVNVHVNYHSIVPFGIIPDIDLNGESRRTIINTLPLDDAPVAPGSQCIGTITRVIPPAWVVGQLNSFSVVGEPVVFQVQVIADDPALNSPGTLKLYIDDTTYTTAYCTGASGGAVSTITCTAKVWDTVGDHYIRADYKSSLVAPASPCYNDSKAEPWLHKVGPSDTEITQFATEDLSYQNVATNEWVYQVGVTITVKPVAPGAGIPTGPVVITEGANVIGTYPAVAVPGYPNEARVEGVIIPLKDLYLHHFTAVYDPGSPGANPGFNQSPAVTVDFPAPKP